MAELRAPADCPGRDRAPIRDPRSAVLEGGIPGRGDRDHQLEDPDDDLPGVRCQRILHDAARVFPRSPGHEHERGDPGIQPDPAHDDQWIVADPDHGLPDQQRPGLLRQPAPGDHVYANHRRGPGRDVPPLAGSVDHGRGRATAHIGGMVVFDQDVDGTAVSFTAPRTGTLEVSVTGYNRCTPSDVVKGLRTIGNQYPGLCELFSEIPQCAGTNLLKLIAAVLAVIGIFASFLLVFFLAVRIAPKQISGFAALLIALIASGILALAFVGLGVLDPLIGAQLLQGVNG